LTINTTTGDPTTAAAIPDTHRCTICPARGQQPRLYTRAQACEQCRIWLRDLMLQIPDLHLRQREALIPARGAGQRVSGSRQSAPIPINVAAVDLQLPSRPWNPRPKHSRDQVGYVSTATRLELIASDWISYLQPRRRTHKGKTHYSMAPTVESLSWWLLRRVEWACDEHPAIADTAAEILQLHTDLTSQLLPTVDEGDRPPARRPERRSAPCPSCDQRSLWWWPNDERVKCAACPRVQTESEYDRWTKMVHWSAKHQRKTMQDLIKWFLTQLDHDAAQLDEEHLDAQHDWDKREAVAIVDARVNTQHLGLTRAATAAIAKAAIARMRCDLEARAVDIRTAQAAEIAAKRRIARLCQEAISQALNEEACAYYDTVRELGALMADRAGYREEWRP